MRSQFLIHFAIAGLCVGSAVAVAEAPAGRMTLNIEAQPMEDALNQFAQQSGLQVLISSDDAPRGVQAPRLVGSFTADTALRQLLAESGLKYEFVNAKTVAIRSKLRDGKPTAQEVAPAAEMLRLAQAEGATPSAKGAASDSAEGTAETADSDLKGIPEILVEGSRSLNADVVRTEDDAQPYYIFDSGAIEQSGALNVEDFLKRGLPMNTAALTSSQQSADFRGNQSSINLRGLGANQTLVLVNGRRTASPGLFSGAYQPDLNSIPPSAIERIEVLPSSSAAIYGGSAVGGVVNVILKRGFTGGEIRLNYEDTLDGHAPIRSIGGSYGLSLEEGRTHFSFSAQFSDADPLLNHDRPQLLRRGISRVLANSPAYLYGLDYPFWGATPNIASVDGTDLSLRDGTPLNQPLTSVPVGFTAGSDPAGLVANAGSFNFDLPRTAYALTGLRRPIGTAPKINTVMASFQREMTDQLSVYLDYYRSSNVGRTPNYSSFGSPLVVPDTAPTNPFRQSVYITIPDPYTEEYRAEAVDQRATAGFALKLPHRWTMASDYTWSESRLKYGAFVYSIPGISADLASGVLNPFVDTIANPLDLSRYRGGAGASQPGTLNDATVRLAGPLFAMPGGEATLTVGLERRREALKDGEFHVAKPNYPLEAIFRRYFGQSQTIKSLYAEAGIPIIGEKNSLPGLRLLDLQLSARTEHFSIGSGTAFQYVEPSAQAFIDTNRERVQFTSELKSTNPTIGLRFKPLDSLTLRASYGTAFLPPTYGQLVPGNVALVLYPGAISTINVIDRQRGNALTQVQYASGGNPDLKPQDSENWNFGLIFAPTFAPGLRINAEWYRIDQKNVIFAPNAQLIVDKESEFHGRVARAAVAPGDPYDVGEITFVDYSLFNANRGKTAGIDLNVDYRLQTSGHGVFDFSLSGTRVKSYEIQTGLDAPLTNIVNQVANDGPLQKRANVALTWSFRELSLGWAAQYYGSYPQYAVDGATAYVEAQGARSIPSQTYHNLFASYRFSTTRGAGWGAGALSDVTVQAGIRNVFNSVPPFDAFYQLNYFSPFGDARLRSVYLTLAKKF